MLLISQSIPNMYRCFSDTLCTTAEVWKSTGTSKCFRCRLVQTSPSVADPRVALTLPPLVRSPRGSSTIRSAVRHHSLGRYSERCFDSWNSFLAVIPVGTHSLASAGRESDQAKANLLNSRICWTGLCSPVVREIVLEGTSLPRGKGYFNPL